jgi:coproporphyrinogen III oxidase
MTLQLAESRSAQDAYGLVQELQSYFVQKLDGLPPAAVRTRFQICDWLRAQGQFGGGARYLATDEALFNRASVNVSQVQYEKDPARKLGSASAISTIVHPRHPFAPSMHMHISWTEMKSGLGYWRIMGDLNPSLPVEADTRFFDAAFKEATGPLYDLGRQQGDRYFYIPALHRHRGVAHFYLEEYRTADAQADFALARRFGLTIIDSYVTIVTRALLADAPVTHRERQEQLAYHTLYFLQVLTLDRGTTSGLLVHDENDTGILGSLPSHVDKSLLSSWLPRLPQLQQQLLQGLIDALGDGPHCLIDDAVKVKLANVSRLFYRQHPEAQQLLARGDVIPPTQDNHR